MRLDSDPSTNDSDPGVLTPVEISLLVGVGAVAGVLNTLAGGGSLLTVPLLVLFGLPGTVANGTNRVGILLQSLVAVWRFKAEGISELRNTLPLLVPIGLGSMLGAVTVTRIPDAAFERLFAGDHVAAVDPDAARVPHAPRDRSSPLVTVDRRKSCSSPSASTAGRSKLVSGSSWYSL